MLLRPVAERQTAAARIVDRFATDLEQNVSDISRDGAIRTLRDIFIIKRLSLALAIYAA